MPYTRIGLVEAAKAAGYDRISDRLVTDWVARGLLDKPERLSHGKGNGRGAVYQWPDRQLELFLSLLMHRDEVTYAGSLASVPVSAWLYWGDEWIPLRQVKVALKSWWDRASANRSRERVEAQARQMVKAIVGTGGSRDTRNQLRDELATCLEQNDFNSEALLPLISTLLESQSGGRWGPFGLTPQVVVEMLDHFNMTMQHYGELSDGDFYAARSRHRESIVQYAKIQPLWSLDPVHGHWFQDPDFETLVNSACKDLILSLGIVLSARASGRSLGPVPLQRWT